MQKIKSVHFAILTISLLLFTTHAIAGPKRHILLDYMSKATYVDNYDGDTVKVDIPGLHPLIGDNINIRIRGIDTPEIRGKCQREKIKARKAKKRVRELLTNAKNIMLEQMSRGKYFRIVAVIVADGVNIGETLIIENLAIPYFGGKKTSKWCD